MAAQRRVGAVVDHVPVGQSGLELREQAAKVRRAGFEEAAAAVLGEHPQRARVEGGIAHAHRVQGNVGGARGGRNGLLGARAAAVGAIGEEDHGARRHARRVELSERG